MKRRIEAEVWDRTRLNIPHSKPAGRCFSYAAAVRLQGQMQSLPGVVEGAYVILRRTRDGSMFVPDKGEKA